MTPSTTPLQSAAQVLRRHGLRAKKSWGQCFLQDLTVVQRIADQARLEPTDTVVEIGAGLGTLTQALARRCQKVLAIERDRDLAEVLRQELGADPSVQVLEENALTFDLGALTEPAVVVGNLPYNIASPLLFHILAGRQHLKRAVIMIQQEMAERLTAGPSTKAYGVPSVLCQQVAEVSYCFTVPPGAFLPPPRVHSAVVRLEMREQPRVEVREDQLRATVKAAFNQRRKTLRKALGARFSAEEVAAALQNAGIDGGRRGESLTVEEFGQLARHLPA